MKTGAFGLVLLLGSAVVPVASMHAPPAPRTSVLSPATVAAVDAIAKQAVRSGQTPGLVVGVSVDGSPVFVRSYGIANLDHDIPVTDRTVFRIGSVTKQFTAAAILLLAEDGKLSLNDPLSRFFPDFPRASEVTMRQLLNHTSGIHSYTGKEFFSTLGRQNMTTGQMVDYIATLEDPYDFDPGTSWNYSNSGYYLLGAIIEKVTGMSYADFMKARIFDPQGLRDTASDDTAEIVVNRANGYGNVKHSLGRFINASYIDMSGAGAAGAMRSTAPDLLKWTDALLGGKVLKPPSLAMMIEPSRLENGHLSGTVMKPGPSWQGRFEYGFGLAIAKDAEGRRTIRHNGAINGFNAYTQYYLDQDVSIVLLSNADGGSIFEIGPKLAEAFFNARAVSNNRHE